MKDIEHVITVYATWNDCGLQATLLQNSSTRAPTERRMSFRWLITNVPSRWRSLRGALLASHNVSAAVVPAGCSTTHSAVFWHLLNQAVFCNAKHAGPVNISIALERSRCSSRFQSRLGVGVAQRMIDSREGTVLLPSHLPTWPILVG